MLIRSHLPELGLCALMLGGCGGWEPVEIPRADLVSLHTPDLVSNVEVWDPVYTARYSPHAAFAVYLDTLTPRSLDGRAAPHTATFASAVERAIFGGMTLLRASDGATIPAEPRGGFFDLTGTEQRTDVPYAFSLVPTVPIESLEEGWYVFRVDLSGLDALPDVVVEPAERQSREGRVLYARVYRGSRPMWRHAATDCGSWTSECRIGVVATEASTVPLEGTLEVRYDGELVTCTPVGSSEHGVGVACPHTQHNENGGTVIEVDFLSDMLVGPNGESLVLGDGVGVRIEREVGYPVPELGLDLVRRGGS